MRVGVYSLKKDNFGWFIDLGIVVKALPQSPADVMDIVTKWAKEMSKLRFCSKHKVLLANCEGCDLQLLFDDLGRGKHMIAKVPDNTYHFEIDENLYHLFVDEGSPFKYLYLVNFEPKTEEECSAVIYGLSLYRERVTLFVDFYTTDWMRLKCQVDCPSEEELERIEKEETVTTVIPCSQSEISYYLLLLDDVLGHFEECYYCKERD